MTQRVAHIIAGLGIGGAERHLVNLLNAMSCEYRAAVFLGESRSAESFYDELDPRIDQHFVRVRRRSFPFGIVRLVSILRRARVNVVHTHMFDSNLYGALAAKLADVSVVVTSEHGENPWKRPFHRWIERRVISPLVDTRFCVSPEILSLRRDLDGVPEAKLKLTVNGTLLPPAVTRKRQDSVLAIGSVGRFIPAKDYRRLLEAIAILRRSGYYFEAYLIGDGPEMGSMREAVAELQLSDTVHLPGFASNISAWYERFDIFVSSSMREGQPVAVLEAMAHGLPVVVTDVGASAETVRHEEGGLVVPPGDAQSIATALGRLLDDAGLRSTLGRKARARVEAHYSVEAVVDFYQRIYHDLLVKKKLERNPADHLKARPGR